MMDETAGGSERKSHETHQLLEAGIGAQEVVDGKPKVRHVAIAILVRSLQP
jgi:hypothetical protein